MDWLWLLLGRGNVDDADIDVGGWCHGVSVCVGVEVGDEMAGVRMCHVLGMGIGVDVRVRGMRGNRGRVAGWSGP